MKDLQCRESGSGARQRGPAAESRGGLRFGRDSRNGPIVVQQRHAVNRKLYFCTSSATPIVQAGENTA
jgi:hypothetical protein